MATGVNYLDAGGQECEQPADIVILGAFSLYNVHLMLVSKIGPAYDPVTKTGTVGKNYSYQNLNRVSLFFDSSPAEASTCDAAAPESCAAWLTEPVRATSAKYRKGKLKSENCMTILCPQSAPSCVAIKATLFCLFSMNQNE